MLEYERVFALQCARRTAATAKGALQGRASARESDCDRARPVDGMTFAASWRPEGQMQMYLALSTIAEASFVDFHRLMQSIKGNGSILLIVDVHGASGASFNTLNRLKLIASEVDARGGSITLRGASDEFAAIAQIVGLDHLVAAPNAELERVPHQRCVNRSELAVIGAP